MLEQGFTGRFVEPPIKEGDRGELNTTIHPDFDNGLVIFDFGSPVKWIAMDPDRADILADGLRQTAQLIRDRRAKR